MAEGTTKLHALLAVYSNMRGQATKLREELQNTFKTKRHLFEGRQKTFISNDENTAPVIADKSTIQTSVKEELHGWLLPKLAKYMDLGYRIDIGNTIAKADIETEDGETLAYDVPTTTLLQLEKQIEQIRDLISIIPTLDPAKEFSPDAESGAGHFKARDVTNPRTQKGKRVYTLAQATDKFPAQTQLVDEDIVIGKVLQQEWSALITPAKKAELLDRAEILYRAIAAARSRANEQPLEGVKDKAIGSKLLDYVFRPL